MMPGSYGYVGPDNDDYESDDDGYDAYGSNKKSESSDEDEDEDKDENKDDSDGSDDSDSSGGGKRRGKKKPQRMLVIWRKENEVGITEYLGDHEAFFAIIKLRYSDFLVYEVNSQGEVHFTDESVPEQPKEKEHTVTEGAPACLSEEKISEINHMFGIHSKLTKENVVAEKDKNTKNIIHEVLIKVDGLEKQERTNVHLYIKTHYKKVITSTKEINAEKYIQVRRGIIDDQWNTKTQWPKSQQYTHFVLYKENMDTIDAISKIALKLRLKPSIFSYAGTKDKRAKTSQLVSVPEVSPQRLYNATKDNWAIKVGNFSFHDKPLKFGQLYGNRFKMVLRKITASDEVVNKAVENLKSHGFINYYGMHRFGTSLMSNLSIGRALLQSNWSEVINMILTPRNNYAGDEYFMTMALQEYQKNGNAKEALHKLNEGNRDITVEARLKERLETQILKGLSECDKNDLGGAVGRLPQHMKCQYLHAYQSFIWNSIASRRINKFGRLVLPGDLVRKRSSASAKEKLLEDSIETIDAEDSTTIVDRVQEETDGEDSEKNMNVDIHMLTAEEANTTDITEILLPLPGHNVLLPGNEIKKWYVEMLEKDGLSLEKLKHKEKTYSLTGVYRHLLVRPSNVSHSITYYNDVEKHLVQSDKEKLKGEDVEINKLEALPGLAEGKPLEKPIDVGYGYGAGAYDYEAFAKQRQEEMKKGKMKALILDLTLPASCYSTMAIRELLKMDTSTQFQNILDPANAKQKLGRGGGLFGFGRRGGRRGRGRKRGRKT